MGDDITIGVTEIVNNIEVTAQPNDQIIDIDVVDNSDDVTLNITPTVIEININRGSSFARWGTILGNLPDQEDLQNVLNLKADLVGGLVPASQLPSYVDDIVEVANYAALPVVGETGKIYLTLDTNRIYRWSGSVYVEIASDLGYVHLAGTETITGKKIFQNDGTDSAIVVNNTLTGFGITINNSLNGYGINSNNTSNGYGIYSENSSSGIGISSLNSSTGYGAYFLNNSSGKNLVLNNDTDATGIPFSIQKIAVDVFTINDEGEATGTKFIKSGGTSSQFLKANGSIDSNVYALDNTVVHLAGTETISGLKTFTGSSTVFDYTGASRLVFKADGSDAAEFSFSTTFTQISSKASGGYLFKNSAGTNSLTISNAGAGTFLSSLTASSIIKSGGTSSQFLKADGSVDSNVYALDNAVVHLAGTETISGVKTFSSQMTAAKILMSNSSIDRSLELTNSSSGQSIYVVNTGSGNAIQNLNNGNSGVGFMSANSNTATGNLYQGNFNGGRVFSVGSQGAGYFAGSVGIGTTSPNRKLEVNTTSNGIPLRLQTDGSNTGIEFLGGSGVYNFFIGKQYNVSNAFEITPSTTVGGTTFSTPALVVTSGGSVGIGTTSPANKLDVYGSNPYIGRFDTSDTTGGFVSFAKTNTAYGYIGVAYHIVGGGSQDDMALSAKSNLVFASGSSLTERMRINSSGDVLVGTSASPYAATGRGNITVNGTSSIFGLAINGVGKGYFYHEGSSAYLTNEVSGGNIYVTSGGSGGVYLASGATSWTAFSDNRLKNINYKIENAVDKLCTLNAVSFAWKSDESKKEVLGLIAQDVEKVFPQIIDRNKLSKSIDDDSEIDETEYLGVRYQELIPVLVKAIQELKAEIEILKNK